MSVGDFYKGDMFNGAGKEIHTTWQQYFPMEETQDDEQRTSNLPPIFTMAQQRQPQTNVSSFGDNDWLTLFYKMFQA